MVESAHLLCGICVCNLIAGIKDLDEADEAIADVVEWHRLGLMLGVYCPTLDKIREEERRVNEARKRMLQKWLEGVDKVKDKGGPAWTQLIGALRKLGDNALADRLQSKFGPFV